VPDVRDEWTKSNEVRLHFRDWGGSGQPVILLHGLASNSHWWDLVAPILSKDFRVVALDQRGHGQSDKPDEGYDFATVSDDLESFRSELGLEKPIMVGHSWGGDVALEYSVNHLGKAKGLCFVDGGMIEINRREGMSLEKAKVDMAPPDWASMNMTADDLRGRARRWKQQEMGQEQFEELLFSNFEIAEDGTVRSRLSRENHMRIIEALWNHYPSQLFPEVQVPVLVMPARQQDDNSEQSRQFRREESVERATQLLPRSKTVWLEDSVHDVPIQRPELVASVISENIKSGFFD